MKIVILANDVGDRLWPLTSKALPKSLLPLYSNNSMLAETLRRSLPLCKNKGKDVFLVTTGEAKKKIREQKINTTFKVPLKNILTVDNDNAYYQVIQLLKDLPDEEVVAFIPTDQYFWPEEGFLFHMSNILQDISKFPDNVMCLSMRPGIAAGTMNYMRVDWTAETPIGVVYIPDDSDPDDILSTTLVPLYEYNYRPDVERAEELVRDRWVWDLNTFVATMGVFRKAIPPTLDTVAGLLTPHLISTGVARAVIANKVVWSVIENWAALKYLTYDAQLFPAKDDPQVHSIDSFSNLVQKATGKEVVLIGVDNLIIIDTKDKLLIASPEGAHEHL